MPRADIRGKNIDVNSDDGAVLVSIREGEQFPLKFSFTKAGITSLAGYTITAKAVEGANIAGDGEDAPLQEDGTATVTTLDVVDDDPNDTLFSVIIPKDLITAYEVQPTPSDPVYAFFSVTISNGLTGNDEWIRTLAAGMIEVRYNPTETV